MRRALGLGLTTLGVLYGCAAARPPAAQPAKPGQAIAAPSAKPTATIARGNATTPPAWGIIDTPDYAKVVDQVVGMTSDPRVTEGARRRGLSVLSLTWEDTGREQGSALGPNITDLTLQVRYRPDGSRRETTALMPVIRFPNFADRTGDIPAAKFWVPVGNQRDAAHLSTVRLTQVLAHLKRYASDPASILGSGNLLARRDTHFLVSAQAVFLPIPKSGKAEFNPVVFNYQSAPGSPAVLTLLVTRQGTSMSVVENNPDDSGGMSRGQKLYFNHEGQRAAFTAERKSDVKKRIAAQGGPKTADDQSALARGADVLFLVQVPLKHKNRGLLGGLASTPEGGAMAPAMKEAAAAPAPVAHHARARHAPEPQSDVEQAVLGHGRDRGRFEEGDGLKLVRDPRFPIRITVQFYKATSNGVVSNADLDAIARSIGSVYEHADFVGSLVMPEGDPHRPTAWQTIPDEWFPW